MKTNNSIIKTAVKNVRKGAKNYIAYCDKCATERGIARKNDARYDSKVFAKALAGGAAIYLTVAAIDFAIDAAPMVAAKIKGAEKAITEKSSMVVKNMKREMTMREATLDNAKFTDYYVSEDTLKMTHGKIPSDVISQAFLDCKPGTFPRIIIGTSVSDALTDELYTVDGQPKCCPHGEDPRTTKHEKDVTFPMFGDEHIEE